MQEQYPKSVSDLDSLADALHEWGLYALTEQASALGTSKQSKDVVTAVDLELDTRIRTWLSQQYPEHGCWCEESGLQSNGDFLWVVDPLDGTVNYSRGLPLWGISIALLHKNTPIAAIAALPALGEIYMAIKGQGTFVNGRRVTVSNTTNLHQAIFSNGDFNVGPVQQFASLNRDVLGDIEAQAHNAMRAKSFGSAVVEGCWVAAGRLDAYSMRYSHPWDIAGICLFVTEAGGCAGHLDGTDLHIQDGCTLLLTNTALRQAWIQQLTTDKKTGR